MAEANVWDSAEKVETGLVKWSNEDKTPKTGMIVEGIYLSVEEKQNAQGGADSKSQLYTIQTATGRVSFFGKTVLDSKMEAVQTGMIVRIECTGSHKSKVGNNVIDFEVKTLKNTPENRTALGLDAFAGNAEKSEDEDVL